MTKLALYQDYLTEEGYRPTVDDDGDLVFKCEGKVYILYASESDKSFFRLVFPNFWAIESEEERQRVYQSCTLANAQVKVAKIYTVGDDTWASVELFLAEPEHFKPVFERSLRAVEAAVDMFVEKMNGGETRN
jgi:Putative bacterial sensory transduction regulator